MREVVEQVRSICLGFPGVTEKLTHGAPGFFVKKQFVMLWPNGHHDHEFPHVWCAAEPGAQEALVESGPGFFGRRTSVTAAGSASGSTET